MPTTLLDRWRRLSGAMGGTLPYAVAYPIYLLTTLLNSQIGGMRTAGVLAVLSAVALAAVGVLALVGVAIEADRPHPAIRRWLRLALLLLALGSAVAVGLALWFNSVALTPRPYMVGAALLLGMVAIAFHRRDDRNQAVTVSLLLGLGWLAMAAPWVSLVVVIPHYLADRPTLEGVPPMSAPDALRPDAPRRIVLVTFDSLRARSTSLHRPALRTTPTLEALARQSTWFTNFRGAGDTTIVSTSTMLTGMRPERLFAHIDNRSGILRQGAVTGLAGRLRAVGYTPYYATMFFSPAAIGLAGEYQDGQYIARFLAPGTFNTAEYLPLGPVADWLLDKVRRVPPSRDEHDLLVATRATFDRAVAYLQKSPERTFVHVHLAVPHSPYVAVPERDLGKALKMADYPVVYPNTKVPAEAMKSYEAAYEAYVRYGDYELGRFLKRITQAGLDRDMLLVVTADHGEEFIPGKDIHGNGILTEDVTHIPLLIRTPQRTAPRRVTAAAGHEDLVPTILEQVLRAVPPGFPGHSLLTGTVPEDRVAVTWGLYGRQVEGWQTPQNLAAYQGRYKLVKTVPGGETRLFDLEADPRAERDVAAAHPEVAGRLDRELERHLSP